MAKGITIMLMLVLLSVPLHAYDFKPFLVLTIGEAFDTATTIRGLSKGRCHETNRYLGVYPSRGKLILWTAIPVASTAVASYLFSKSPVKGVKLTGKLLSYGTGTWGAYNGIHNVRLCGW